MSNRPTVLFLCVHNAGRSQMAAGWLRHLAGDRVQVFSGGSEPADQVNPAAIAAMDEAGIDISGRTAAALDRRRCPRGRRRGHDGMRRRLPGVSRQAVRGLGADRSGRPTPRVRTNGPRRDPRPRRTADGQPVRSRRREHHLGADMATRHPTPDGRVHRHGLPARCRRRLGDHGREPQRRRRPAAAPERVRHRRRARGPDPGIRGGVRRPLQPRGHHHRPCVRRHRHPDRRLVRRRTDTRGPSSG